MKIFGGSLDNVFGRRIALFLNKSNISNSKSRLQLKHLADKIRRALVKGKTHIIFIDNQYYLIIKISYKRIRDQNELVLVLNISFLKPVYTNYVIS